jgi:hypothetical protein
MHKFSGILNAKISSSLTPFAKVGNRLIGSEFSSLVKGG